MVMSWASPCLLAWAVVARAAAWNGTLRTDDEAAVQYPAMVGNGHLAAEVLRLQYVSGADGASECPQGSEALSEEEFVYFNTDVGAARVPQRTRVCKKQLQVVYLAGVFNGPSAKHQDGAHGEISHRAAVPAPITAGPVAAGPAGRIAAELDLQRGVYVRRALVAKDPEITFEQRIYAHRARPSLMVAEYWADWVGGPEAFPVRLQGPPVVDGTFPDFDWQVRTERLAAQGFDGAGAEVTVWTGRTRRHENGGDGLVDVALVAYAPRDLTLGRGGMGALMAAYRTTLDSEDPLTAAKRDLRQALADVYKDRNALFQEHVQAWEALWQSGFSVSGRPDVAQAVQASTYYILSSLREDRPYSLSPGGLASNGYNGHTFWDTETWMYPPLLVWYPALARSVLDYRAARLPAARAKARSYDPPFDGAMFSWESAATGLETCPTWAPFGKLEQHISADIAFAVRQYFYMTGDEDWLRRTGFPLLAGVADFYVSKAVEDASVSGKYHIEHVIPPDEYQEGGVRDSVYTNFVAKQALSFAATAADILDEESNAKWHEVAEGLVILWDPSVGRHPEFEGYKWGQSIKQADAVLLPYPLEMEMTKEAQIADLDYYAQVTDPNGPAMTWGMHAVGYLAAGQGEKAAKNFDRSFANVKQPFLVWTETPQGGATNFITGAGGFLQTVLFGYFGLRIHADELELAPQLMLGADEAELRGVHFRGRVLAVRCSAEVTVTLLSGEPLLAVRPDGTAAALQVGSPVSTPLGSRLALKAGAGQGVSAMELAADGLSAHAKGARRLRH